MGEISLEASTVNRFIVSLSKSIQALCHGCMDFDDSIEMVGYININIDSGKTVDCVLNEKVRKSAANAMTCISNSFHAKKEKPKQTKDGSCSPIPQSDYSFHQTHPYKRSYISDHNTHSGSSRKKHRHHAQPISSYPEQHSTSAFHKQHTASYNVFHNKHTTSDTELHNQSSTTSSDLANNEPMVKVEPYDSSPSTSEHFLVKKERIDYSVSESQDVQDNPDNSMLDPSSEMNIAGQSQDFASESAHPNFEEAQQNIGVEPLVDDSAKTESSFYDTAADDTLDNQQPHCSQQDAHDGDQFDVIEIGDDDEDVQGLFDPTEGNSQNDGESLYENHYSGSQATKSASLSSPWSSCQFCQTTIYNRSQLQVHMQQFHPNSFPYTCDLCAKGFLSKSGLNHHKVSHSGRTFSCSICDQRFFQKTHLTGHLRSIHKCVACRMCSKVFKLDEFQKHVLSCC